MLHRVIDSAPECPQIEESIATCRFAQRVAMISNKVAVNEEARSIARALPSPPPLQRRADCVACILRTQVDKDAVIRRLKAEVRELREEARPSRCMRTHRLRRADPPPSRAAARSCVWRAARRRARRAGR